MPNFDLDLDQLVHYEARVPTPADFDSFWDRTLHEAAQRPLSVESTEVETPYRTISVLDVTFAGYGGDRIKAWYTRPRNAEGPLPVVVEFLGYMSGRDLPGMSLHWASAGYAHLLVETRGQGAGYAGAPGETGDPHDGGVSAPGFMTKGILSRETYYFRRVYVDAVRAIEAAITLPSANPHQVAVHGVSQGGGIALAAGGLSPHVAAVLTDVPFLCNFRRGMAISTSNPFLELVNYLSGQRTNTETVLDTLSYFDAVNFARRSTAPAVFSVGLMDVVCPPSTVYSAFNEYLGPKEIVNYPYNGHEGGGNHHRVTQVSWLNRQFGFD